MTTTATRRPADAHDTAASPNRTGYALYSSLIGLSALAVLLQGLWAGLFLQQDGADHSSWVDVHARGGEVAIALAILATAVALWKLRERRDLWIGSIVLVVLLFVESYLGGEIRDGGKSSLTIVHVPLAMALMALVVWLP